MPAPPRTVFPSTTSATAATSTASTPPVSSASTSPLSAPPASASSTPRPPPPPSPPAPNVPLSPTSPAFRLRTATSAHGQSPYLRRGHREAEDKMRFQELKMVVKMLGRGEALIRIESRELRNPAATLMEALGELELKVVFAAIMMVKESLVQEVKVVVEDGRYTEAQLTSAVMEIF